MACGQLRGLSMRIGENAGDNKRTRRCGSALTLMAVGAAALLPLSALGQQRGPGEAAVVVQEAMVEAIERAERSVVAIARVRKGQRGLSDQSGGEGLPPGRGGVPALRVPPTSPDFVPQEFATGVVVDRQGHILTNYHVLGDPNQNDYYVWAQRRPFRATRVEVPEEVRAGDPWTDLAVLKVAAEDLEPIRLGDASKLRKGMFVIALGNPYGIARDGEASASWGIVSNLRRAVPAEDQTQRYETKLQSVHQFGTLIQTDACLNLGTSGGALVNLKGEMVGLTTSLAALSGYEQPGGFAIPVDDAFRETLETLKQGRAPSYGFLGVQPESLSLAERQAGKFGARVARVVPGTPADEAGLREQDVITHVDDRKVFDKNALFRELSRLPAESNVALTVHRRNRLLGGERTITADAVLSKKYIDTARAAFSQRKPPRWRGMRVEYPSALPPEWEARGVRSGDPQGCVAVLAVDRDSPAWNAGLRPGQFVSHVESRRVQRPKEFFQAVKGKRQQEVRLRLSGLQADDTVRHVAPPSDD